jgi:hypothetical protein
MALEIAGVTLDKLISIEASEVARYVRHPVPGMNGELSQEMGRPSVRIALRGIFYGADAIAQLEVLRGHLLSRTPVDFVCEMTGSGYVAQVLVDRFDVAERAGQPNEFEYQCLVTEYVPPPPPPSSSLLGDLDLGIIDEAASMMDDFQNALAQLESLGNLLGGASDFGNPVTRLPAMLESFSSAASGGTSAIGGIEELL